MTNSEGVFVALSTPFDESGRLDEQAFRGHLDVLMEAGVHGFVPGGSTGEVMPMLERALQAPSPSAAAQA